MGFQNKKDQEIFLAQKAFSHAWINALKMFRHILHIVKK